MIENIQAYSYLGPQPLQKPVQQHLLVQDLKEGVVQEQAAAS